MYKIILNNNGTISNNIPINGNVFENIETINKNINPIPNGFNIVFNVFKLYPHIFIKLYWNIY